MARKLLSLAEPPYSDASIDAIAEALTEKMYAHGHGIGLDEACQLGLHALRMEPTVESLVWEMYLGYEAGLRMDTTADPAGYFADGSTDVYEEPDAVGVFMESRDISYQFCGKIWIQRVREMPSPLNLNINMPLSLPAEMSPDDLSEQQKRAIQQIVEQAAPELRRIVEEEIARQSPVQDLRGGFSGGEWKRTDW